MDKKFLEIHTVLPGRIITYEGHAVRKAEVAIAVNVPSMNGEMIEPSPIPNVPIVFPSTATSSILLPVKPGDGVLLCFSEVGIGNFLSQGSDADKVNADSYSRFNTTDCIAIPGLFHDTAIPTLSEEADADSTYIIQGDAVIQLNDTATTIKNGDMEFQVLPGGQIKFTGQTEELISLLSEFLQTLSASTVITGIGAQPFTPNAVADFQALKTRLDTLKG
jgi:hypothetical protein